MTVSTEKHVVEAAAAHPTVGDAAAAQELLRTMAAMVRTVFGVALQAPAEAPVEHVAPAAEPVQLAPVSLALPPETQRVSVPVAAPEAPQVPTSVAVDLLPTVEVLQLEQTIGLAAVPVPDAAPAAPAPMTSISLGDSSWAPAPPPPAVAVAIPAYSPAEPTASLSVNDGYPAAIAVPTYAAPVLQDPAGSERHSLALLQEIAFLDD